MSKKIVAAASLSRTQFETFLAGSKASPASKARYERQWRLEHGKTISKNEVPQRTNKNKEIPKNKVTTKEVATKKTRYPIGQKRLNVDYKVAKEDFARYDKATQARYWSAWQKYKLDHSAHKEQPSYRIILSYRAKIDGHVMKDSDGKDVRFYWSTVTSKKRLSKKEIAFYAEDIKESTNVQVFDVRPEIAYDNWTGKQV